MHPMLKVIIQIRTQVKALTQVTIRHRSNR